MKNIFSLAIITLFAFTLTGCGNKITEATCTQNGEKTIVNFENNKIVKVTSEVTQTYDNETLLNMAYQTTQMTVSAYNAINGASAEVTKDTNSITMKLTLDISKMSKTDVENADFNYNAKEFLKKAKKEGFTCTTK